MITSEAVQTAIPIKFNTSEIQKSLKEKGMYEKDTFTIKLWTEIQEMKDNNDENEDYLMFAIQNNEEKLSFLGVVNFYFKRDGYCLNKYLNGDLYFGYYSSDQRNKQGIYQFKPKKKENKILYQYYYGIWKNDYFSGNGIYLWLTEKENIIPFNNFDNSNFYAFVGNSKKGKFEKGALLRKENNNYFVYYGTFSLSGEKEGNKCFYYNSNLEELLYGTFKKGKFIEGYVAKFDENGILYKLIKYKKSKSKKEEKIDNINPRREKKARTMTLIRDVLMSKDYFGILYEEIGKIIKFRDEKMNNLDIIVSDKYVQVMSCFSTFNKVSICADIENNVEFS